MLVRKCCYTLKGDTEQLVNIKVHPCCTVEIEIPAVQHRIYSEVEQLHFKLTYEGMLLVCDKQDNGDVPLHFSRKDALALCQMIDDVMDEHEELMSDLC